MLHKTHKLFKDLSFQYHNYKESACFPIKLAVLVYIPCHARLLSQLPMWIPGLLIMTERIFYKSSCFPFHNRVVAENQPFGQGLHFPALLATSFFQWTISRNDLTYKPRCDRRGMLRYHSLFACLPRCRGIPGRSWHHKLERAWVPEVPSRGKLPANEEHSQWTTTWAINS